MNFKYFQLNKKVLGFFITLFSVIGYGVIVFAATPPAGGFVPGSELNPTCLPGQSISNGDPYDCFVKQAWQQNVGSGFVYNENDKIGIGTATPAYALEVAGDFLNTFTHGDGTQTQMGNNDNFFGGGEQMAGMVSVDPTDEYFYGSLNGDLNSGSGNAVQNVLLDFAGQKTVTITNEWNGGNPRAVLFSQDGINSTGSLLMLPTSGEVYLASTTTGGITTGITLDGTGFHYNYAGTFFTLPVADGTNGQALVTNGSGDFSWTTLSGTPGGADTNIQYNNSGAFGGSSDFTWNNTTKAFGVAGSSNITTTYTGGLAIDAQGDLSGFGGDNGKFIGAVSTDFSKLAISSWDYNAGVPVFSATAVNGLNNSTIRLDSSDTSITFNADGNLNSTSVDATFNQSGKFNINFTGGRYFTFDPGQASGFEFSTNSDGYSFNDNSAANTSIVTYLGSQLGAPGPGAVARNAGSFTAHLDQTWDSGYYNLIDAGGVSHAQIYYGVLDSGNLITDTSRIEASPTEAHLFHLDIVSGLSNMLSVNDTGFTFVGSGGIGAAVAFSSNSVGFGIGSAATSDKLHVSGDIRVGTSSTNGCLKDFSGGTITGTCSSDERLKINIQPVTNILDKLTNINLVTYDWNELAQSRGFSGGVSQLGVLAQNVEQYLPELVITDKDGYKQVNYGRLNLLNLQAIKELNLKVASIEEMVDVANRKFKGDVAELKQVCLTDDSGAKTCVTKADLDRILSGGSVNTPAPTIPEPAVADTSENPPVGDETVTPSQEEPTPEVIPPPESIPTE